MGLSDNLIKYRKMKSYTQDDIAEMMGVSRQSVSKWENGEAVPDINRIIKLADCLDVTLDALFDRGDIVKTEQNIVSTQDVNIGFKPSFLRTIVVSAVLMILGITIGIGAGVGIGGSVKKNNNALEGFYASAFSFSPCKNSKPGMDIEFVPSEYNDIYEYVVFANADEPYYNRKCNLTFDNGVMSGSLNTVSGMRYNIVLQVSDGEQTRNITLAEKVWGDGSGQNITSGH